MAKRKRYSAKFEAKVALEATRLHVKIMPLLPPKKREDYLLG
ncbi:hypothetical protein [Paracoccus litorisediminis]|nr:hypothetical protein [Paracoccus litorisediminis]